VSFGFKFAACGLADQAAWFAKPQAADNIIRMVNEVLLGATSILSAPTKFKMRARRRESAKEDAKKRNSFAFSRLRARI